MHQFVDSGIGEFNRIGDKKLNYLNIHFFLALDSIIESSSCKHLLDLECGIDFMTTVVIESKITWKLLRKDLSLKCKYKIEPRKICG